MKARPLVSCITPFLNAERFLAEAVESVLAQTYDHWELLLIDDGSTDESTSIAFHYVQKYPGRIRYLEHEGRQNRGLGISRDLGLEYARGEFIAFLDSDDIYLPQKLEKQVALLEEHPEAGMVFGAHNRWYSWTGRPEDVHRDEIFLPLWGSDIQAGTLVQPPRLFIEYLQNKASTPLTCGVLLRREVVERVGGFDDEVSFLNEDGPFFAKVFFTTPVFLESGCWDRYRQHANSTTAIARAEGRWFDNKLAQPVHYAEMKILERFLIGQAVTDPVIWEAMETQLFPYRHPHQYAFQESFRKVKFFFKSVLGK